MIICLGIKNRIWRSKHKTVGDRELNVWEILSKTLYQSIHTPDFKRDFLSCQRGEKVL